MSSHRRRADALLAESLAPMLEAPIPAHLGSELYRVGLRRLRAHGMDEFHAEEVFSLAVVRAWRFLQRFGSARIENPKAWLYSILLNTTVEYLKEHSKRGGETSDLGEVEGRAIGTINSSTITGEERIIALISEAIENLTPRHRELIYLDLGQRLSTEDIKKRMKIRSDGYFRKLKCEALGALRASVKKLIENSFFC